MSFAQRFAAGVRRGSKALALAILVASVILTDIGAAFARQKFAAIAVDARNGAILFSDDANGRRYPASLTKVMTLYVLFQDLRSRRISMSTPLRVSARAASMPPTKIGARAGTKITVETAIKALIVHSANDAATVIAENLGGTEANFAARMTRVARTLGMSRTNYANASGLPNPRQITTAKDQATLALRVMRDFPQYYPYFRLQQFTFRGRTIRSHNRLVGNYEGTDGLKTGFTNAAGYNLMTSTRRDDKRLVGVVLGARSSSRRSVYMMKMFERGFPNAKGGTTVAALAGSPKGIADPLADRKRIAAVLADDGVQLKDNNSLALAAASASEDDPEATASNKPEETSVIESDLTSQPAAPAAWKIQVGNYETKELALKDIRGLQSANLAVLQGKQAFTVTFEKGEDIVYRARFSGFDKSSAKTACRELSKRGMNCSAISPQS